MIQTTYMINKVTWWTYFRKTLEIIQQ